MGKKSTANSGKAQIKAPHDEVSNNNGLTGVFHADFIELLEQQGLPAVDVRSCHKESTTASTDAHGDESCPPTLSRKFPVFVDYEDEEDSSTLKSLHIRNWLVSERVVSAMTKALAECSQLKSINLWNVGLTENALKLLTQLVTERNIKHLWLDGNAVSSTSALDLLGPKSSLELLSLKCCQISDVLLAEIAPQLSNNKSLLHLNMSCNNISDDGINSIATSLRLNRTLLSLSLTNNNIGDVGALSLAKVLSRFELNHLEIVQRRRLLSLMERSEETDLDKAKEPGVHRSPSATSVDTKGKTAAGKDKGQLTKGSNKKTETKKEDKGKKDDKTKKGPESKKNKGKDSKTGKKGAEPPPESPRPEPAETINPLLDPRVEKEQDKLFIPGNTTLVYLTLAFNRIGEDGVHAFLEAIKVQELYSQMGCGLLKLSLHHNLVSDKALDMIKVNEFLSKKESQHSLELSEPVLG